MSIWPQLGDLFLTFKLPKFLFTIVYPHCSYHYYIIAIVNIHIIHTLPDGSIVIIKGTGHTIVVDKKGEDFLCQLHGYTINVMSTNHAGHFLPMGGFSTSSVFNILFCCCLSTFDLVGVHVNRLEYVVVILEYHGLQVEI